MLHKKIHCPVCKLKIETTYGKSTCVNCGSLFEVLPMGKVKLIKSRKFDYWALFIAIVFPILIICVFSKGISIQKIDSSIKMPLGFMLLLYPLITFLYMIFRNFEDEGSLIFEIYSKFFKKKLHQEDAGKIIAFYITFITNIIGLTLILWSIFEWVL